MEIDNYSKGELTALKEKCEQGLKVTLKSILTDMEDEDNKKTIFYMQDIKDKIKYDLVYNVKLHTAIIDLLHKKYS